MDLAIPAKTKSILQKLREEDYCTPTKKSQRLMNKIQIPASPYMKRIGYGTGIVVYELIRSSALNKVRSPWALKKLLRRKKDDTEIQNRLKNEADILRKLVHPNIVGFRAFLEKEDGNILAMEECTSCLGNLIENRSDEEKGPFDTKNMTKVCFDVAKAMLFLHNTALLMHCDLKSYNILIQGDFEVCKLCDFGVCLPATKEGNLDVEKAPLAEYVGTTTWSAPEVLCNPQVITTKADIYSYGLIIFEMIALCPPMTEDLAEDIRILSDTDHGKLDELLGNMTNRERPPIPAEADLGEEYNPMLEIYYCCTEGDKNDRPHAADLVGILGDISNKN